MKYKHDFKNQSLLRRIKMSDIERVNQYLSDAEVFYLATVTEENKPKCRPLGFHMLENEKIYFGVGTFKEVYKQIEANPYVEIVATIGPKFIRYYGKVVLDDDEALVEKTFAAMPEIGKIYKENGWEMGIFHLEEATAEFRNMMGIEETVTF